MATPFNVEISVPEAPADAQARAATALNDAARAIGLRLTKRAQGELTYRPTVQFPFLLMLYHNLNGERMRIKFGSGESGGSRVTITGAVARSRHPLASDPEHWTEALGGSAS